MTAGFGVIVKPGVAPLVKVVKNTMMKRGIEAAGKGAAEGGLNLFKFGSKEATSSSGWKSGDRFFKMYDQYSPKLNWKQNSGFFKERNGSRKSNL